MQNAQSTLSINPNHPTQPPLPTDIAIDPSNPLIWILVITTFIGTTEKPLNATANLLRSIASLISTISKTRRSKKR